MAMQAAATGCNESCICSAEQKQHTCATIWYEAEINAWLATMLAAVMTTNIGQNSGFPPGRLAKKAVDT
jgi:hypothetical protein